MSEQGASGPETIVREPAAREQSRGARRAVWVTVAVALMACGIAGSVFAAVEMARNGAANSRREFRVSSADIASNLQLAILHEQDLIVSASGFVIGNPDASNAQFVAWANSVQALGRYPELLGFGHAVIVPAAQLPRFAAHAVQGPAGALPANRTYKVLPAGKRPFYCLAVSSVNRDPRTALPAGYDYCSNGPVGAASLASRESGQGAYLPLQTGKATLLSILTPVYQHGIVPATAAARRQAFLGWVGMSVMPQVVLARALQGHSSTAVTFRYHAGPWNATFHSGNVPSGAEATTIALHNGWSVEIFAVVADGGLFANGNALALLIAGIVISTLLASLVLALGTGRARALRLVGQRTGELRHQATHDALTGLPNRALITDRIDQLLARNRRTGTDGALLYVDLDEFKNVNDSLGHEAGDQLLVAVADRLTRTLREADTIGRMGGDEFVVLIDGGDLEVAPELVAERLLDVMRQPFELAEAAVPLSVNTSIGIAAGDRASAGELLRDADVALYQAKAEGKNRYQTFDPELESNTAGRIELEFDLRSALEGEQFRLVYQPIYNLEDLTIVAVEALLRWQHPTQGVIPPGRFVPILERTGQIREVGRWVLDQACAQMAAWHARGDTLDVSINVSGAQLDDDAIVDHVREALATSGLDASRVIIEVTETALMRNAQATARRLRAIKELGVRVAIDDFGIGYSSLAYLQQFPVDCLKIDRMFTNGITTSSESRALIATLVQLGKDLGLKTLAEGVETPDQLDHLRGGEVDEIQGFLLSKPLDAAALEVQILAPTRPGVPTTDRP